MKLILFVSLSVILHNANASKINQIFLYAPPSVQNHLAKEVIISSDKNYTDVFLNFPSEVIMKTISSYCSSPNPQYGDIPGFVANIVSVPRGIQSSSSGLRYSVEVNWPAYPGASSTIRDHSFYINTVYNPWELDQNPIHECWPVGKEVGLGHGSIPADISMKITVDRGTATPGNYELLIPMYHAYSELKVHGYSQAPINNDWPNTIMQYSQLRHTKLPVSVVSNCNITNGGVIQLDHGVMTPKSAVNNEAKTTVDLTCTDAATVNVKLLGNEVDNKSSCSSWGTCELTFDNGTNEDKLSISGTKTLSIKSTFKPKALEPIAAGKFTAHGVLQILVE